MTPILKISSLCKQFGGITATNNIDLNINEGEIHAVIGPNGAGKTTLISQLSGDLKADKGAILFQGDLITNMPSNKRSLLGIARTFQITSLMLDMSTLDNVALAVQAHSGHSYRFWQDARQDNQLIEPALYVLKQVGLLGPKDIITRELSHGEHRQLEIAMALATQPKLLLLDEPMAGMGGEETQKLIAILKRLKTGKTMILIEHDMNAVFSLADRITVMVYGEIIATGSPKEIRANQKVKAAYLGDEELQTC
ncbi:MAG: ATP-binding cassette domain-containing protein [Alphaproteobacteria bacterium]|nr:ATP-binding cassette domain-containing protein [Alphaproteobacteria bacterium]